MNVRQANQRDYESCAGLDASVQSSHVWQLRLGYDPLIPPPHAELGGLLQATRLPRPVVTRPAIDEPFDALWRRAADVLVAEDVQGVAGYVVLALELHAPIVSIARLAVAPVLRRGGIGGLLLGAAGQWGAAAGCATLLGHCPARNYPASAFYMRYGLRFAGYSEALYPHGEIALLWQRPL